MYALSIYDLVKVYSNDFFALNSINISINCGDFFSILGKNGAGKSTIIGILTSLIKKTSGKVYIYDYDLDRELIHIKKLIGVVPQEYNFNQFELVIDIVLNSAGFYGLKKSLIFNRARQLLKLLDLWDKRNCVSMHLSGGMKRRLMLVRALIHDPDILILDEPTAGIDIFSRKIILDFLRDFNKLGKTIILTTHYLEDIEALCNKVAIIDKGVLLKEAFVTDISFSLNSSFFIFKIDDTSKLANITGFKINLIDSNTFEVYLLKNQDLSVFLKLIIDKNIFVFNIINKNSSLEEFFINSLV